MKKMPLLLFILLSCQLMACRAFELRQDEYQYLDQLALPCADKSSSYHNYTEVYAHYFHPLKDKPLKFLEIGVFQGGSVQLWENYFKHAELHFIDVTLDYLKYFSNRAHYHIVDQSNVQQLERFIQETGGQFDIILDDGGHTMVDQIVSFKTLFPYLNSGGLYIIEDLHTSYWTNFGGGSRNVNLKAGPQTTIQFLKNLIDDVNFVGARTAKASHRQDLSSISGELNLFREQILGLHFYDSVCIIIKR